MSEGEARRLTRGIAVGTAHPPQEADVGEGVRTRRNRPVLSDVSPAYGAFLREKVASHWCRRYPRVTRLS